VGGAGSARVTAPLRVGVIGLGWAGQQHLAAYAAQADTEIVALAGLEDAARKKLATRYAIEHSVARWEDLLDVELDAVSVAVPTFLHAPIAIAALERGIHVLSEKPIARNAEEADAMVAAARAADRVLDVAFNHRQRGDIQRLKAVVDAGQLGRPYYAKAWWLRRTGIPTLGSWFTQAELAGGGPLVDIGVHVLDYSLFLLGNPKVRAVSASTYDLLASRGFGSSPDSKKTGATDAKTFDVEDLASVFMRLADGGTLLVEASWAAHRRDGDEFGITLYGTEGGAELIVDDYAPVGSLRVFSDRNGAAVAKRVSAKPGRGHDAVIEQFVARIRSGRFGDHDGSTAASLARVVDACYRSAAEQREVIVDEPRAARSSRGASARRARAR
jgi:predicted dehydrogenase